MEMNEQSYVYAGVTRWGGGGSQIPQPNTLGGVFRMPAQGGEWTHMMNGLPEVMHAHCITLHPQASNIVFIGTHVGVFRSDDHGANWRRMALEPYDQQIWSIAFSPHDPNIMFAGASPIGMYKSEDGGASWLRVPGADFKVADRLPMGNFRNRVMRIAINPNDALKISAAMEVNGAMGSEDGGRTWNDRNDALIALSERPGMQSRILTDFDAEGMLDAHALCMSLDGAYVYLACRMGIFRSADNGLAWQDMLVGNSTSYRYGRDVRASKAEPGVLYACLSVKSHGETGSLQRSDDGGKSWKRFDHGVQPHNTVMAVGLHDKRPELVYMAVRKGEIFGTQDAGRTWNAYPLPNGCDGTYCIACG